MACLSIELVQVSRISALGRRVGSVPRQLVLLQTLDAETDCSYIHPFHISAHIHHASSHVYELQPTAPDQPQAHPCTRERHTQPQRWQHAPAGAITMTHVDGVDRMVATVTNDAYGIKESIKKLGQRFTASSVISKEVGASDLGSTIHLMVVS